MATSTSLSSIARSIAARESGMAPAWKAKPSMNMLLAIESPKSAPAMRFASTIRVRSAPARAVIAERIRRVGSVKSASRVKSPG